MNAQAREAQKSLKPFVAAYLAARVLAEAERERVDKIQRRVLAEDVYTTDQELTREPAARLADPKLSYLLDDESSARYFAKMNAIHAAAGFPGAEDGRCPACCAEHDQTKAEWALIEAAAKVIPQCAKITNDQLLCGTKDLGGLECRQKFIDLIVGLCLAKK
jgi:hypothetical protein